MIILNAFQWFLMVPLALFIGYLAFLSLIAIGGRKRSAISAAKWRRFAVVIPAHNEEQVLSTTLQSLDLMHYPKNRYQVYVIADNCTDRTAEIVRHHGAIAMERFNEEDRGKGYALRWAFDKLQRRNPAPDAYVVFDADSTVSENFLTVMNGCLEKGSLAIQASDLVRAQPDSWSSEATRIGFLLYNYVRPLGRSVMGVSVGLRGNGMCFDKSILERFPWQSFSQTEDLEYGLYLLKNDVRVDFAPEAIVTALMPASSKIAESQRARWEMGRYPIIRRNSGVLLHSFLKSGKISYLDALVDLVMPPFVNMVWVLLLMVGLNLTGLLVGRLTTGWLLAGWGLLLVAALIHLFLGLWVAGAERQLYRSILYIPRYAVWKVFLYSKRLVSRHDKEWVRTGREIQ